MSTQRPESESSPNAVQTQIIEAWSNTTDNIFCTGHGGTGKSWVLHKLSSMARSRQQMVTITAPTGAAAFSIGGVTINKFAGIGIETENIGKMIAMASTDRNAPAWKNTDVLIIDEISMVSAIFFENLNLIAKTIRECNLPFGGIRLVLLGDFLQLPPVSKGNSRATRAFECDAWEECQMRTYVLTETMRQTDSEFISNLSKIRIGLCDDETARYFESLSRPIEYDDGVEAVKLFALRRYVDIYNQERLSRIDSPLRCLVASDKGPVSALVHCPVPRELNLKKGCQVMIVRNLSDSLVNGTIGTLTGFRTIDGDKSPVVDVIRSDGSIKKTLINKVDWQSMDMNGNVLATRVQFPLILAWAVTIHKAQGKTIPRLYVDMAGIFEAGQAYVALSRCSSPKDLQVSNFSAELIKADPLCVAFHNRLMGTEVEFLELPPSYDFGESTDTGATNVAESTHGQWDNTTVNTELMLGRLSIQSDQESSGTLEFGSER
jgi:ATP-dependent DNA helicase PIF1